MYVCVSVSNCVKQSKGHLIHGVCIYIYIYIYVYTHTQNVCVSFFGQTLLLNTNQKTPKPSISYFQCVICLTSMEQGK